MNLLVWNTFVFILLGTLFVHNIYTTMECLVERFEAHVLRLMRKPFATLKREAKAERLA